MTIRLIVCQLIVLLYSSFGWANCHEDAEKNANSALNKIVTDIVKSEIPESYTDDRKWGKQVRQYAGFKFRREGWKLETKRRWKMVNDGTWRRYSIGLVDPNHAFEVKLQNIRKLQNGNIEFTIQFKGHVWLKGRQSKWTRGVQLYSVSADGEAYLTLQAHCELDIDSDWSSLPPELILKPKVTGSKILVEGFRIHRVSKVGGEFAQQITRATKKWLDSRAEKDERKIVEKLNKQLAKKKDKLRIDVAKAARIDLKDKFLPHVDESIRKAVQGNTKLKSMNKR